MALMSDNGRLPNLQAKSPRLNRWARLGHVAIYPALIVITHFATLATENAIPFGWAWRAPIVVLGILLLLQAVGGTVLRNWRVAAPLALAGVFWLLGDLIVMALVIEAFLIAEVVRRVGTLAGRPFSGFDVTFTKGANIFGVALLAAALAWVVPAQISLIPAAGSPREEPPASAPDIFLILLDGYPRADTLASRHGFDNTPFLLDLEGRGFDVADRSRSNYNSTVLTLASMLSMEHIRDIPNLDPTLAKGEQRRRLAQLLAKPPVADVLRGYGYAVTQIASPFPTLAIRSADQFVDTGQLNGLEIEVIVQAAGRGPIGRFPADFLADQHRERIREAFEYLTQAAVPTGRPRFVLAHLLSPHTPFVFYRDGDDRSLQTCFPSSCGFWDSWVSQLRRDDFSEAAVDQINYINREVLASVDALLAKADVPPIIIVMSDHGSRLDPNDPDEMHRNLFAAYTPGHEGLFGSDTTPVVVFPRLLRAYFGLEIAEPASLEFQWDMSSDTGPLDFLPYDPAIPH